MNYTPVTLEQYNQSLRDAVNAYYTHAQQDPTMSQEEVYQSTAAMSEQYLDAVDEFEAAQNADISVTDDAAVTDDASCTDGGEDCNDDLDL